MVSTHAWKAASPPPAAVPAAATTTSSRPPSLFGSPPPSVGFGGAATTTTVGGVGASSSSSPSPFATAAAATAHSSARPFVGGFGRPPPAGAFGGPVPPPAAPLPVAPAAADFESLLADSASLLSSLGRDSSGAGLPGGGAAPGVGGRGVPPPSSSSSSGRRPASSSAGGAGGPLGDRSLLELSVASRVASANAGGDANAAGANVPGSAYPAASSAPHATTYESEASAHRLLAREGFGFDSARLGRSARDLERRAGAAAGGTGDASAGWGSAGMEEEKKEGAEGLEAFSGGATAASHPLADLGGASVRRALDAHHEHCVRAALRRARDSAARTARMRADERLKRDWERERAEALGTGTPGGRFLGGAGGVAGRAGAFAPGGGVAPRVPALEGDAGAPGGVGAGGGTPPSPWEGVVPSPRTLPPEAEGLARVHLAAIDRHLAASRSAPSSPSDATKLLASLREGLKDPSATDSGLAAEALGRYADALSLLESLANSGAASRAGGSSDDVRSALAALGTCDFLARQFASHVRASVREAELGGRGSPSTGAANDDGLTSAARDVRAYARLAAGEEAATGRGGVWTCLFYCLRCGDAVAASSILDSLGNAGGGGGGGGSDEWSLVDPAVFDVVSELVTLQGGRETVFGDGALVAPSQALTRSRLRASDLYERTKSRGGASAGIADEAYRPYRAACLALLSGAESVSEASTLESSGIVGTVEDYLYGSLWHALHLAEAGMEGEAPRAVAGAVARLGALVDQWGPAHFEDDADIGGASAAAAVARATGGGAGPRGAPPSGGWAYALPLLVAQRYATALAYLAEAGGGTGLLQATHAAVVMDVAGLPIEDFTPGDWTALSSAASRQTLLPMLVASYSASLQVVDAGAALKYLVLLSDKGKFVKEQVQRLLLETRQFETLAGRIQPDGSRSNGALDAAYFSKREVSSILQDAANHAIRVGKPADAAELLVLSGRFGALFELMNRELASYLNASTPEDLAKREFWFNAASQFHAIHLADKMRTYVQNTLDAEGRLSLGNTFQLLMNLVVFFDRCHEGKWDDAWGLIDHLQLIPKSNAEMTVKVEAFRALDNCVRQVFHHVVLSAMEALCHLYQNLKHSGTGGGGGVPSTSAIADHQHSAVDQRLYELRDRARLLVTFSRLLNLPSLGDGDTYRRISQLEKNMM